MLFVPYAEPKINEYDEIVKSCPECDLSFIEQQDDHGRQTSRNYVNHYNKEHRVYS